MGVAPELDTGNVDNCMYLIKFLAILIASEICILFDTSHSMLMVSDPIF